MNKPIFSDKGHLISGHVSNATGEAIAAFRAVEAAQAKLDRMQAALEQTVIKVPADEMDWYVEATERVRLWYDRQKKS
jgi:hypothetical protein